MRTTLSFFSAVSAAVSAAITGRSGSCGLRCRCWLTVIALVPVIGFAQTPAQAPHSFEAVEIDANIGKVCYAVTAADVNGDGKLDIVAVSENRVQWYENPTWTKHIILEDQTALDNVCIAAHDIDGDGQIDFALGAGWTKIGTLQWITRGQKPGDRWKTHMIAQETWLHRMSFADVLGKGRKQLVISPLNKTVADGVRLTAFEIPEQPAIQRWPATVLDDSLDRMHNHTHIPHVGGNAVDTIVACQQGVYLIRRDERGEFQKVQLGSGAMSEAPAERGAGEVRLGKLPNGKPFLATVEPMHGTQVVVYLPPAEAGQLHQRLVLDDTFKQGHAVWLADLDGRPGDELVAGYREAGTGAVKGPGLMVYRCISSDGTQWKKQVIDDGGVAVEDAVVADFDGDGRPDLVAGGRATHNVKLYWNRPPMQTAE